MLEGKIKCPEGCYRCCGVILFTKQEEREMKKELRKQGLFSPPNGKGNYYCEYLTEQGKCSVYNKRPLICRIFGVVDTPKTKCELQEAVRYIKETQQMRDYAKRVKFNGIMNKNGINIINQFTNGN